jgi:hypothetical protein
MVLAGLKIGRLRAAARLVVGQWPVRLVLFVFPGLFVLYLMNANWSLHIANIGCIGIGPEYRLEQLFTGPQGAGPGCAYSSRAEGAGERLSGAALGQPPARVAIAEPAGRVAIADGRFQWMTFHLIAKVLFAVIALVAVVVMHRNLGRGLRAWAVIAAAAGLGLYWRYLSQLHPGGLEMDTASLLVPTRIHALSHFDASFRDLAWDGVRWDYGWGLAVTILITIAAASILADTGPRSDRSPATIDAKRRDLKLVIGAAALLMTFLAFYVGEWLAWPARFAASGNFRGSKEEFEAVAAGLRLYFGTGYSLALIAAAVPAVLMLPKPRVPRGDGRDAAPPGDDEGYFYQSVFRKDEISLFISVLTPFVATLAGGALQL